MALLKGAYLGDVTALCFVQHDSIFLLAGTGAQISCYSLTSGKHYFTEHIFDGVRIHGIHSAHENVSLVAVHGERRVKLFKLIIDDDNVSINLWQSIPRFTKWVLDVHFLKGPDARIINYLAAGLSDNSVCIWDMLLSQIAYNIDCSEKCLLYSMRLWGDSIGALRVAAGTIYNEVLVWTLNTLEKEAKPLQRLHGHEGSIYRIAWSRDGHQLGSVSDDRSARLWRFSSPDTKAAVVFFGHAARVWDLHIDDKYFITASEDCTCGVWSLDGQLLKTLKGHTGRGIWRCIFDPETCMLVTAGADAAIKLYSLKESYTETEFIEIKFQKIHKRLDSKSEYVRCINFAGVSSLYVATNLGLLQHVNLSSNLERASIFQTEQSSPVVCMDVQQSEGDEVCIACGDGQGRATCLRISSLNKVHFQYTWTAEAERQLLGVFWCKSLDSRYVFTTDPKGGVRCWFLSDEGAKLHMYFKSSFCSRIVCMDASFNQQVLACGDQRGNLIIFRFDEHSLGHESAVLEQDFFRGAHGVSAVASVLISPNHTQFTRIISTGRDGCICEIIYENGLSSNRISCSRVEKIPAITVVESLQNIPERRIAAGFAAADFILWDITNEVELKRFHCGGWKRPHSFLVGEAPESQFCFAFLKDEEIHVYRRWETKKCATRLQALQKQSHGREIHTVFFASYMDLLLTGSEDGMVQITQYTGGRLKVLASLDEHLGGSAVRALAVSRGNSENILFSAGSKEVLTCWLLNAEITTNQLTARWLSTYTTFNRKPIHKDQNKKSAHKDDLRYLAITAFAVRSVHVHFVVTSMSNAVITVKAFDLPNKSWHNVAVLSYHTAPVLALHHVVLPQGIFVFSGSTDGSIAVWELSQLVSEYLESDKLASKEYSQDLRPRSGRGSQGGKSRYRLNHQRYEHSLVVNKEEVKEERFNTTLEPVLILPHCHQSGVNTLCVSTKNACEICVISGGDDQALHFTLLSLQQNDTIDVLTEHTLGNAHSSAVKGVWTDGEIIFSTGLDQRLRCWRFSEENKLVEICNCVIDVPEAEALHARILNTGFYRIAVAGRGLQIVNFKSANNFVDSFQTL